MTHDAAARYAHVAIDEVDVGLQLRVLVLSFVGEFEHDVQFLRVEVHVPIEFLEVRGARLVF